MSKVTTKLQVTIPKAIAQAHAIAPGTDVTFESAGDVIRVRVTRQVPKTRPDAAFRLKLFLEDTARQKVRDRRYRRLGLRPAKSRGWRREDLYSRGIPR